jgi:ketosteroid isomerase-like protein
MTADENRNIIRAVFDATATGDGRLFVTTLADNVEWSIIGTTSWSRTYTGKAEVLSELLGPLAAQLDGANTIIADRLFADGDMVIVEGHGRNTTKLGKPYANRYCWVIRMAAGKMAEITEYTDTQLIAEALAAPQIQARN